MEAGESETEVHQRRQTTSFKILLEVFLKLLDTTNKSICNDVLSGVVLLLCTLKHFSAEFAPLVT